MNKDVTQAIAARSDQLNADDLVSGPMTIKITDVNVKSSSDQPIEISFEGSAKLFRPCKTAARCLAAVWGPNAAQWTGLHCTIYNDPTVTWAGAAVGGIRVSHMEGLDKPRQLSLSKTRGKKSTVTIQPLVMNDAPAVDNTAVLDEARAEAAKGKDVFTVWWKANKQHHDAVMPIMGELKALMEKAIDDEVPL